MLVYIKENVGQMLVGGRWPVGQVGHFLGVNRAGSCWSQDSCYCLKGSFSPHHRMLCLPGPLPQLRDNAGKKNQLEGRD